MMAFFFSFSGRIARRSFATGFALILMISVVFTLGLVKLFGLNMLDHILSSSLASFQVETIVNGLLFWPLLALGYKRMHDLGKSGKVFGIACFFYLIMVFFGSLGLPGPSMQSIWFLLALLISFSIRACLIIILILQPGDRQSNEYGPAPDAPSK